MGVARGVTPTFTLTFPQQIDLTLAQSVYVTFQSGNTKITKSGEDLVVAATTIGVFLNQQETLAFSIGNVDIQANWISQDGKRLASEISTIKMTRQLLDEVIE